MIASRQPLFGHHHFRGCLSVFKSMNEELCPIKFCLQSNLHLAVVRFACSLICLQSSLLGCSPICLQSDLRLAAFQFAWLHSDLPAVRFALGCIPICLQSDLRLAAAQFAQLCSW